jgi:O-antigen ligase
MSRVGGTIGDANTLAMYLNLILPVLLCLLFVRIHFFLKVAIGAVILLGGITEILTLSRGGWMALGVAGMIALFGVVNLKLKSLVKSAVLVVLLTGFVAGSVLAIFSDVRERLFESDYGSAYSRIPMSEVALAMIEAHPLLGVGLNNYATVMNGYDHTREFISYKFPYPVHDAYLLMAGETGIPSLLCIFALLVAALWKGLIFFRSEDTFFAAVGIGWVCGILTWAIHALFKMTYAGLDVPLWIVMGIVASMHHLMKTTPPGELPFADIGGKGKALLARGKE